jgi:phosphoribosylamine--glycine ligase
VGKRIDGLEEAGAVEGVKVFHAGTSVRNGAYYTAGGRVLGVTARARDLGTAVERAYEACAKNKFDGEKDRRAIAARAVNQ